MQHNVPAPAGKILQLPHQPAVQQDPVNTILEAQAQSIPESWWLSLLVESVSKPDTRFHSEPQALQMCCIPSLSL